MYESLPFPAKFMLDVSAFWMKQNPVLDALIAQSTGMVAERMIVFWFAPITSIAFFSKSSDFGKEIER